VNKMDQAVFTQEVAFWKMVAQDLGIDIAAPFDATLSDGNRLHVAALVKDFGPPRGMLIALEYNTLKPHRQKIIETGFGYSAQIGNSEKYDRGTMINILKDWGWSGASDKRPIWLDGPDDVVPAGRD
jgi:hypothetical protein